MEKKTKIRLIVGIITIILCLIPWDDTPLISFEDPGDIDVGSNLGFVAMLLLALSTFMVVSKDFVKYAHWVSLMPFALFVYDFLQGNSDFSEYVGIYVAQIATLVYAVVFWKYRNQPSDTKK